MKNLKAGQWLDASLSKSETNLIVVYECVHLGVIIDLYNYGLCTFLCTFLI